ncbi:MAG: shikimate dehydrogenase [Candidatus Micrarchaeota archaeon]
MLCTVIAKQKADDAIQAIKEAAELGADIIELRIDFLSDKGEVKRIISSSPLPVIATNREGNQSLLTDAIKAGAKYVDMDMNEIDKMVIEVARKVGCKVILSYHNIHEMPSIGKLTEIYNKLKASKADLIKIVPTSNSKIDNATILSMYDGMQNNLIAFAMGEIGKPTRLKAVEKGARWMYCATDRKVAPGQYSLEEARKVIKRRYFIIGDPIGHSVSPQMHNSNFSSLGLNSTYEAIKVAKEDLKKFVADLRNSNYSGGNVTIPHKIEIRKYVDEIDPLAKEIGSINTVKNFAGKLVGYNTDGYGALLSLEEAIGKVDGKEIAILGAGGAARAIAFTFEKHGAKVTIVNRDAKKAKEITNNIAEYSKLAEVMRRIDILINCTPLGMSPKIDESPVPKEYFKGTNKNMVVFDIVYNPLMTKLLKEAKEAGFKVITGEKMLAYQASGSFEIWTGMKADAKTMLEGARTKLNEKEGNSTIALIGFMGTGKTTIGSILAQRLNKKLIDIDKEIENEVGKEIDRIFEEDGESHFRLLEKKAVMKHFNGNSNAVVSCGGGTVLDMESSLKIKECSRVVLLRAKPETIVERLKDNLSRPLLHISSEEKIERIKKILKHRKAIYEMSANYVVDTDGLTPGQVADKIMEKLGN